MYGWLVNGEALLYSQFDELAFMVAGFGALTGLLPVALLLIVYVPFGITQYIFARRHISAKKVPLGAVGLTIVAALVLTTGLLYAALIMYRSKPTVLWFQYVYIIGKYMLGPMPLLLWGLLFGKRKRFETAFAGFLGT